MFIHTKLAMSRLTSEKMNGDVLIGYSAFQGFLDVFFSYTSVTVLWSRTLRGATLTDVQ